MKLEIKNIGNILFGLVIYFLYTNLIYSAFNIPNDSPYAFLKILHGEFLNHFYTKNIFTLLLKP